MKIKEITDYLEKFFPIDLQMDFDNSGYQITNSGNTKRVMIALNANLASLDDAISKKCNLLITHHPFIFKPLTKIDLTRPSGQFIKKALANDIAVYSLHTCLDIGLADESMNHWLIKELDVEEISYYDDSHLGKMGKLKVPVKSGDFIQQVKDIYRLDVVHTNSFYPESIRKVAVVGGAGADDLYKVAGQVDCFITGDCKYHNYQDANDLNILLLDVGHHVEVIVEEKIKELLKEEFTIEVLTHQDKNYRQTY